MADTNTNTQQGQENVSTEGAVEQQAATFTQADVDNIVNKRLERERKKYPSADELTAFRAWKQSQQTENEKMDALQRERLRLPRLSLSSTSGRSICSRRA